MDFWWVYEYLGLKIGMENFPPLTFLHLVFEFEIFFSKETMPV